MSKPGCEYYWFLHGCRPEPSKEIIGYNPEREAYRKSIGNHFSSKEEAEKAREKLKALKRLEDNGFKAIEWAAGLGDDNYKIGEVMVGFDIDGVYDGDVPDDIEKDLDILFGGEE